MKRMSYTVSSYYISILHRDILSFPNLTAWFSLDTDIAGAISRCTGFGPVR